MTHPTEPTHMPPDGLKLTARVEKAYHGKQLVNVFYDGDWLGDLRIPDEHADRILALLNGETEKGDPDAT
jgi:hypothetical protein